ncbi:MAG: response regulator [Candidatus Aureabacteria bacterium]|nr:response regulator [Candidatus Auribacterota bacterium]
MSRILVVDDGKTMVKIISKKLEANGFDVIPAYDGQEAVLKAREENPDLIILDLNLPRINGFMVCRILKYDEKYRHIPIILLTARKSDADKWIGIKVGADAYLTKPVEMDLLVSQVKELLGN